MTTQARPVVELKHRERNKHYLTLEVLAALVNAGNFVDAGIVLESFRLERSRAGWDDLDYDQFKRYLSRFVDFADVLLV